MADDDGAAGEILKRRLQRRQGLGIEIIGGLVEEQQIAALFEHLGEVHAIALAAGEQADLFLLVGALEVEPAHVGATIHLHFVAELHVGSRIEHFAAVRIGDQLSVRAKIVANDERKGHRFVELDGLVVADEQRPIARIAHTAIWQPRARPA